MGGDLIPGRRALPSLTASIAPAGSSRPEILSAGPDPVALLHCLRRRWLLGITLSITAAMVCALLALMFWPVEYDVEALLHVARNEEAVLGNGPRYRDPQGFDTYRRTQTAIIRSSTVLTAALRDPAINQLPIVRRESDQVSWLEKNLLLDYPGDSEVLRVRMRGENPSQLVKVVDAVVKAYLDKNKELERGEKVRTQKILESQLAKAEESSSTKRNTYLKLARQMGSSDLESARVQQRLILTQLNDAQSSLRQLKSRLMEARVSLLTLMAEQERLKNGPQGMDFLIESELLKDPNYAEQYKQLTLLEMGITQRSEVLRDPDNSPSIRMMKASRDQIREELDSIKQEKLPVLREIVLGESVAGVKAQISAKQQELKLLEQNVSESAAGIKAIRTRMGTLGRTSGDLEDRAADLETSRTFIARIKEKLNNLALDLEKDARVKSIQPATAPETGNVLKRYFVIAFAGMCGLAFVLFGVAYWEFQARRINSSSQVTEGLGIPVVGTLPALSGNGNLISFQGPRPEALQGLLTESIDSMRTALIYNSTGRSVQTIVVTSPADQEGKTTVSSQLATSLARSGRRTLLVDGDLRSPGAHELFELSLEDGLCEVLRGAAELDYAIRPTRAIGLWLLTAGCCDQAALDELDKQRLREVFDKLKSQFDFIVIDSAPVLSVADTLLIGQHADAAVLALLQGVSRVPKVYEATERLESVGIPVMGAVVGGVSATTATRRLHEPQLQASA